jgi:hypothetical protein
MTKQPELPEFYRDLEITQSLNKVSNPHAEPSEPREATDMKDLPDGSAL